MSYVKAIKQKDGGIEDVVFRVIMSGNYKFDNNSNVEFFNLQYKHGINDDPYEISAGHHRGDPNK